jgi:hypothetical protein
VAIAPKIKPASKASGGEAHGVRQKKSPKAKRSFEFINCKKMSNFPIAQLYFGVGPL